MHPITAHCKTKGATLSFAIAGGSLLLLNEMLAAGGASEALCHATVLYSKESIDDFIDMVPEKYVSKEVAIELATEASVRNLKRLSPEAKVSIIAVGITESLATENQREGRVNEAYIAILHESGVGVIGEYHLVFSGKTRYEQEIELSKFVMEKIFAL